MNGERRWARFGVALLWGLGQLLVLAVLFYAGGVAGAYLGFRLLPAVAGGRESTVPIFLGFAAGLVAAGVVNHEARMWVQRLRIRALRRTGVRVDATVVAVDRRYTPNPKGQGSTTYTVTVRWPGYTGRRAYRFWGRGSVAFETVFHRRATVPVRYAADRPGRFVLDVPFAPTMADLVAGRGSEEG